MHFNFAVCYESQSIFLSERERGRESIIIQSLDMDSELPMLINIPISSDLCVYVPSMQNRLE